METSHYIDIGVVIIVLLLGLRGLRNGLVYEIMGFVGIVIGVSLASSYCVEASYYLELAGLKFDNKSVLYTLTFILILFVILIGFLVIGMLTSRFIVIVPGVALVNYFGGYVFAAIKYFVILSIAVYGLGQVGFLKIPMANLTKDTRSYPMMHEIAEKIMNLDTIRELKGHYLQKEEKVEKELEEGIKEKLKEIVKKHN